MSTTQIRYLFFRHLGKKMATAKKAIQCCCLVVCASTVRAQEVKLYTGCNMVLTGNIYVVMNNTAFKNNGVFTAGSGTVVFTGNTDTSVAYVSGSSNTTFNNLTLDKMLYGIALKSSVGVKNVLTLSAGNFYSNSNLTLLSDSSNTARLAAVPSGANIYGTAMVERYIPSKRAWRLMTAPITNAATIYNSWQNAGVYTVGKGLLVSGPTATYGLDNGNGASLKTWNATTQALVVVTNTYTSISKTNTGSADNTGYFVFIRGDRNPSNFVAPNTNITTLTSIGSLQTGTQTFSAVTNAGGYTLIGNPYASPIDFNAITRTNLVKRFYVWDPLVTALGNYVAMDDLDNDGVYSNAASASLQTKEIQSAQAFFVETDVNGSASLTINETAKSSNNNIRVFRPVDGTTLPGTGQSFRANIYLLNPDATVLFADGTLAEFAAGFSDNVTNQDALKFSNIGENLAFLRYGVTLAIERRPLILMNDTLFLKLWNVTNRSYQLRLMPENLSQTGLTAYLEDSYLATSTPLSLADTATINFTVDANVASANATRFRIVFKRLTVLPIAFTAVKAYPVNETIQVDWLVQDEVNTIKYEVEKSANGSAFSLVNTTAANAAGSYSWIDAAPFTGENFYRIKSTDRNGEIKYSQVVYVLMAGKANHFTIQPNPVKGNSIHLQFANQPKGNYQFNLFNNSGQLIWSTSLPISSGSTSQVLKNNITLPDGVYQLQITGPANSIEVQKVIIQQ
ncbi:MAG: type sorting protein [Ferruginibacter sp.]|nr:type sorting protein [Ferruginibacter sp.]